METEKKRLDSKADRREATLKAFNEMAKELQSTARSASSPEKSLKSRSEALSAAACRK